MFSFLKRKKKPKLQIKIKELENYINHFSIWSMPLCEETMNRMCDDEIWDGYNLSIDVDAVYSMIKEEHINPVQINISSVMPLINCDGEREIPPLTLMPDGTLGFSDETQNYMKKKINNPIIIVTSTFLPPMVINGNHRIAAANKKGDHAVEGYIINIDECKECMLKECFPVYEAYTEWARLRKELSIH